MGRGTSKAGGGSSGGSSGGGKASDQDAFVNDMVNAMTRKYDRDEVGFSNSDLQASVEAYALTHKGVNEDALLNTIRDKVDALSSTSNSVSGKPFKASDWKTWTPGTKVEFKMDDDIVVGEDRGGRGVKGSWVNGTVKSIGDGHIIVDVPTVSDHMWVEDFNAKLFRAKKKR